MEVDATGGCWRCWLLYTNTQPQPPPRGSPMQHNCFKKENMLFRASNLVYFAALVSLRLRLLLAIHQCQQIYNVDGGGGSSRRNSSEGNDSGASAAAAAAAAASCHRRPHHRRYFLPGLAYRRSRRRCRRYPAANHQRCHRVHPIGEALCVYVCNIARVTLIIYIYIYCMFFFPKKSTLFVAEATFYWSLHTRKKVGIVNTTNIRIYIHCSNNNNTRRYSEMNCTVAATKRQRTTANTDTTIANAIAIATLHALSLTDMLQYLMAFLKTGDVIRLSRVNRTWHEAAKRHLLHHGLRVHWAVPRLQGLTQLPYWTELRSIHLTHVVIPWRWGDNEEEELDAFQSCHRLQSLRVHLCLSRLDREDEEAHQTRWNAGVEMSVVMWLPPQHRIAALSVTLEEPHLFRVHLISPFGYMREAPRVEYWTQEQWSEFRE